MTITEPSRIFVGPINASKEEIKPLEDLGAFESPADGFDPAHLLHGATVTVVFPCLDEEMAVGLCVKTALDAMRRAGLDGSVIVVDNGSTDDSPTVAAEAGAKVIFEREPGYGAALRAGINAARSEYVIMADADGTYELDAIPRLLLPLINGDADMVLGQRLSDATSATMPWLHRYVGTPAITYLVKRVTKNKVAIRDSQSGFRAFRREEIVRLNLSSTGMEFASEMLIRSAWANLRIGEVDTKYAERIGESKLSTFSDGLRHLRQILLLSPETSALIPGVLAMSTAVFLWVFASTQGLGQVGSLSWVADVFAGVLSIVGPLVFCTGTVLKYRAESLGFRTEPVRPPLEALIRRFFIGGIALVLVSVLALVALVVGVHNADFMSKSIAESLSSFLISSFVVGVVLLAAPVLSPILVAPQRSQLPVADIDSVEPRFVPGRDMAAKVDSVEECLFCLNKGILREA